MTGEIALLAMDFIRKTAPYVPVFVCITDYVGTICTVSGRSMQPTFNARPGGTDAVIIDKWTARSHSYRRGDVVVLKSPSNPMELMTKRVIGLGGDWVCGRDAERKMQPVRAPRPRCERTSRRDSGCHAHVSMSPRSRQSPSARSPPAPRELTSTHLTHSIHSRTHPCLTGTRRARLGRGRQRGQLERFQPLWRGAHRPRGRTRARQALAAAGDRSGPPGGAGREASAQDGRGVHALLTQREFRSLPFHFFPFFPRYPRFVSCMHSANQEKPECSLQTRDRIACRNEGEAPSCSPLKGGGMRPASQSSPMCLTTQVDAPPRIPSRASALSRTSSSSSAVSTLSHLSGLAPPQELTLNEAEMGIDSLNQEASPRTPPPAFRRSSEQSPDRPPQREQAASQ